MKNRYWQKILVVFAAITCLGCSYSTTPQLMKQDVKSVVFEWHQENGLQSDAKWADLSQDEQSVLSQWMTKSPLEGRGTLVTSCNIYAGDCD